MLYTIYKTTNKVNGKIYIGKHQTEDFNDTYLGSGKKLLMAIKKYGIENFEKETLFQFDNETEMNDKEAELVSEEFCARDDVYNLCTGGKGGWSFINRSGKNLRTGMIHTEASRQKMGTQNNKFASGKRRSDEWKIEHGKIMSEKLKGKPKSEEHKRKIAESIKKKHLEKTLAGMM